MLFDSSIRTKSIEFILCEYQPREIIYIEKNDSFITLPFSSIIITDQIETQITVVCYFRVNLRFCLHILAYRSDL